MRTSKSGDIYRCRYGRTVTYRRSVMVYKREHAPRIDVFPEPR